jgi:hypothetical protein
MKPAVVSRIKPLDAKFPVLQTKSEDKAAEYSSLAE